jgi:L-alanine-DL-glutamate epimerase-like enolase superfamily enzyme
MDLTVRAVQVHSLRVPFAPEVREWNSLLVEGWQRVDVVEISCGDTSGWGEQLPAYTWKKPGPGWADQIIGRSLPDLVFDDDVGLAVQMAALDLWGKAVQAPAYRLLGRRPIRRQIPMGWWCTKMPPECVREQAKTAYASGYRSLKLKARPWFDVRAQVAAVTESTHADFRLELDFNDMLLGPDQALLTLHDLAGGRVDLVEGPIPQTDLTGMAYLRKHSPIPTAMHAGYPGLAQTLLAEAASVYVLSDGGLVGLLHQADCAAAFDCAVFLQIVGLGLTQAFIGHLGSVVHGRLLPSITCRNTFQESLLTRELTPINGDLTVPDAPGLGVEVDRDRLGALACEPTLVTATPDRLLTVSWPDGRTVQSRRMIHPSETSDHSQSHRSAAFAPDDRSLWGLWDEFLTGNHPPDRRGARLQIHAGCELPGPESS